MPSAGPNDIAVALAVGGIGLGVLGVGRRCVYSLSLIGATLGLAGAAWLLIQTFQHDSNLPVDGPAWLNGGKTITLSIPFAFFLVFHSVVALLLCRAQLRSPDRSESSSRLWVAAPIAVSSVALFQDPFVVTAAFFTATVVVALIRDFDRASTSFFRLIGGLLFVTAVIFGSAKSPMIAVLYSNWSVDFSRNWPLYLLGAGVVVPLCSSLECRGGPALRMLAIAAPFLLTAALIIQIGDAPFSGRLSSFLLLSSSTIAAWHGWNAFRASDSWRRVPAIAGSLLAIGAYHWINSSTVMSPLAYLAMAASTSLAFLLATEDGYWRLPVRPAVGIAGVGVTAAMGGVLSQVVEKASTSAFSIANATIWVAIAFILLALCLAAAALKHEFKDGRIATENATKDRLPDLAILSVIAMLAGAAVLYPAIFPTTTPLRAVGADLFHSRKVTAVPRIDLLTMAIGLSLTLLAIGVGFVLPQRLATNEQTSIELRWSMMRVVASPFIALENFVEGVFLALFGLFSPRRESVPRRAPSPAAIVLIIAVAGAAAMLSIQRRGVFSP